MGIYTGKCKDCSIKTDIFDATDRCITCTRLDKLEKLPTLWEVPKSKKTIRVYGVCNKETNRFTSTSDNGSYDLFKMKKEATKLKNHYHEYGHKQYIVKTIKLEILWMKYYKTV